MNGSPNKTLSLLLIVAFAFQVVFPSSIAFGDGKVVPLKSYKGSLEEKSQEAIIIFNRSTEKDESTEDLILKIQVEGEAEKFAWVIPFPNKPEVEKEDPKLFKELFDYVQHRKRQQKRSKYKSERTPSGGDKSEDNKVQVLSREVIGDFDVVVVKETEEGGLNPWLDKEGFQTLEKADDVIGYYRKKQYCFACIKVNSKALKKKKKIESHPLRFTFHTGGRDGIYFPMKMTSLQNDPFDVNLYVFTDSWVNDKLSRFGFRHRGFDLNYRDWDTAQCVSNAGKTWSLPEEDPFLKGVARRIPTVKRLFQKLHPGRRYYLTNVVAKKVIPADVRQWKSDLWMFPHYNDRAMVPFDARAGGPAADAYPGAESESPANSTVPIYSSRVRHGSISFRNLLLISVFGCVIAAVSVIALIQRRRKGSYKSDNYGKFDKQTEMDHYQPGGNPKKFNHQ